MEEKKRGRPLKFTSPEELQEKIDEYFSKTPIEEQMITGLALHLDTSRETLCNYEKEGREEFFDAIKRAKAKIEFSYEKRGLKVGNAFDIFRLKNMGWKDRYDNDITTGGEKLQFEISKEIAEQNDITRHTKDSSII